MREQRRRPESAEEVGRGPDRSPTGGPSRWVVVIWIVIAFAVLALVVFLHLSGAIGPGTHQGG